MKIAIVHDHLTQIGGAEKVLSIFHEMFSEAPIFTLVYDKEKIGDLINEKNIKTSFIQKLPWGVSHYQWYLSLMPTATESYDLTDYDVVISSSSALAKGVITQSNTHHICYCHTPTRYLWSDTHLYLAGLRYPFFIKKIIPFVLNKLRIWDYSAAQRVDVFIANSKFVADRIKKYYRRESTVIYPPVDTDKFSISDSAEKYYLTGGRLVSYKKFDITVKAFNQLNIPLKIFGSGPQLHYLKKIAKPNIEFLGRVDEKALAALYQKSIAFIHPQIEDFGITAVEAMASGRPVIAFDGGGARETIVPGITGEFFDEETWECLADKIVRFKPESYQPKIIKGHAEKFGVERFKKEILNLIESAPSSWPRGEFVIRLDS